MLTSEQVRNAYEGLNKSENPFAIDPWDPYAAGSSTLTIILTGKVIKNMNTTEIKIQSLKFFA